MAGPNASAYTRRAFIRSCAAGSLGAALGTACPQTVWARRPFSRRHPQNMPLHPVDYWESLPDGRARCLTCPNRCVVAEGEITACRTRILRNGQLCTMTYGKPCVVFTDPLEKNPLYHVDPGQQAIGIGTAGCNLSCTYCQNWAFSQVGPWQTDNMDLSPKGLVEKVRERGLRWITFSYTEPVAYYEYALAAARLAQDAGIRVAVVTAGYICKEPLHELIRYSDAFSVTLKGYSNQFYEKTIGCPLEAVWDTIVEIAHAGKWMEIVNLVVPTLNDDLEGIRSIARATTKLNPDIPLHFLRFAPAYRLKHLPPTPVKTLEQARETALDVGLRYVYLSNLPGHDQANTCCPSCGSRLIERVGFNVLNCRIQNGHCPDCGTAIPGMWS